MVNNGSVEHQARPAQATPPTPGQHPSDSTPPTDPAAPRSTPSGSEADAGSAASGEAVAATPVGEHGAAPEGGNVAIAVEGEQSDAQAEAAAAGAPVRLGRRGGRSPRDMAISLLVLLIPIALLLTFYRVVLSGDAPVTIDAAPTIQQAEAAKAFPVAVPQGLANDWHTTSATFTRSTDGVTLRLGYVAPDDDAALVIESNVPADKLLRAELGKEAQPRGTFRDGEVAWRSYVSRPGETALVLLEQNRTIIVLGNTKEKNLQMLAAAIS
jgi:Protein of unknown function (DUF4245)